MSKYKNILFRCDSSSRIGLGHVMRDLVLAKQYPDTKITFATLDLKGNINHKIIEAGYNVELLQSNDKKELVELIKKLQIDLLIIDHYKIGYKKEKYIQEKTSVTIFVLDDTYKKHYCDILLNHNLGADKKGYKSLVPKHCELQCGSKYTLLREEFYTEKAKMKSTKTSKIKTIFVAMGGADTTNTNPKILKILSEFKNIKVNLITTSSNKKLKKLQEYVTDIKWVKLHIDPKNIASLMRKSDFAIITPSVTANEAYFMELPFLSIKTAINQNHIFQYLKQQQFLVLERFDKNKLKDKLCEIL